MNVSQQMYFNKFIELIKTSLQNSYIIQLPKCEKSINLFEKNSRFYLNLKDIQYILKEIFNINYSIEINLYLKNILKIEYNNINNLNSEFTEEIVFIDTIDVNFFESIRLWIKNNPKQIKNFINKIQYTPIEISSNINNLKISNIFKFENICSNVELEKNKKILFRNNLKSNNNNNDISNRPFTCNFINCKRAFKRLEHLKRHKKIHTGEKPFLCTYPGCNKFFSRGDNLNAHYKIHIIKKKRKYHEKTLS